MLLDRRRYIGSFAVFALVLLRVVIGWHFLGEGAKKIEYDRYDGQLRRNPEFSAEGFLSQAKGPFAELYHMQVPDDHGWREHLAKPQRHEPPTAEEGAAQAKWAADYRKKRSDAAAKGELSPVDFPPQAPYADWARRIQSDWQRTIDGFKTADPDMTDAQKQAADKSLNKRLNELADYLAMESEAITEYRHDLWRAENWQDAPEGDDVPFYKERISTKLAETAGQARPWVDEVRAFDAALATDLNLLLTPEQSKSEPVMAAFQEAVDDARQPWLNIVNMTVTGLTIGVGICLLLGLFTRLASILGALFLLTVIASQPFWLADSVPTMPQIIEFAALLVLAGTRAGRWAGLDYFPYALFNRYRRDDVVA
jgi:uncharacterized membrane protein YphA (DoxX/SURF4 family)